MYLNRYEIMVKWMGLGRYQYIEIRSIDEGNLTF